MMPRWFAWMVFDRLCAELDAGSREIRGIEGLPPTAAERKDLARLRRERAALKRGVRALRELEPLLGLRLVVPPGCREPTVSITSGKPWAGEPLIRDLTLLGGRRVWLMIAADGPGRGRVTRAVDAEEDATLRPGEYDAVAFTVPRERPFKVLDDGALFERDPELRVLRSDRDAVTGAFALERALDGVIEQRERAEARRARAAASDAYELNADLPAGPARRRR